jgi:hypothetical protein
MANNPVTAILKSTNSPAENAFSKGSALDANFKLSINPRDIAEKYVAGNYDEIFSEFTSIVQYFNNTHYYNIDEVHLNFVNVFVKVFLDTISFEDFKINESFYENAIAINPTISNLICISDFKTSDPWLKILLNQQHNLIKVLMLYSHRNKIDINPKILFDYNADLASRWYAQSWQTMDSFVTKNSYEKARSQIREIDDRLIHFGIQSVSAYMRCTYVEPENDRNYKKRINNLIQLKVKDFNVNNKPKKNSIAIVTGRWWKETAVYKSSYKFIESLAADYDLTLIHIESTKVDEKNLDTKIFKKVLKVNYNNNVLQFSSILNNDFSLVYFPDVGMVDVSTYLANLRIAPIQVMGYGHPVSTFGSKIDYLIGGQAVENYKHPEADFSERLVLLPGLGAVPVMPEYIPEKKDTSSREYIMINCAWGDHKINYNILKILKTILLESNKSVRYQLLQSAHFQCCSYVAFKKEIVNYFHPYEIDIHANLKFESYMDKISDADFAVDAYPFGGYNTIVNNLVAGVPVVAWEGKRSYNRLASGLLRQLELDELIVKNERDYVTLVSKLIDDDVYRKEITSHINNINIVEKLIEESDPAYFKHAIDYIIKNHKKIKNDKKPIYINNDIF